MCKDRYIFKNKPRIQVIGDWRKQFPCKLRKILENGIEKTKHHTENFLSFMLAYDGGEDVLSAVRTIKKKILKEKTDFKINSESFREFLLSRDLPEVDLLIRTGVENDPHNSAGFLMWQTQNSQYHFSNKFFPEFKPDDLVEAIRDFGKRERRMGE